jgi:hypothetical protein
VMREAGEVVNLVAHFVGMAAGYFFWHVSTQCLPAYVGSSLGYAYSIFPVLVPLFSAVFRCF